MSTTASAMCTLCGIAGTIELDMSRFAGHASAFVWSQHFAQEHPEAARPSEHVVVVAHG